MSSTSKRIENFVLKNDYKMLYNIWTNQAEDQFDIEPIGCNMTVQQTFNSNDLIDILNLKSHDAMIF